MSKPLTMKGPCVVCGATDYAESCGGPTICPMCDCGVQPTWVEVRALRASLAAAEAKLTAASKAAIDMMNRHRDVVLSLESKLADAEKHADALYELSVAQAMLLAAYRMHRQPTGPTLDTLNKHRNLFDAHAARRAARDGQEGTR